MSSETKQDLGIVSQLLAILQFSSVHVKGTLKDFDNTNCLLSSRAVDVTLTLTVPSQAKEA